MLPNFHEKDKLAFGVLVLYLANLTWIHWKLGWGVFMKVVTLCLSFETLPSTFWSDNHSSSYGQNRVTRFVPFSFPRTPDAFLYCFSALIVLVLISICDLGLGLEQDNNKWWMRFVSRGWWVIPQLFPKLLWTNSCIYYSIAYHLGLGVCHDIIWLQWVPGKSCA